MHGLEQTAQAFGESDVTKAATEPACFLEIRLGETADGALLRRGAFLDFFGGADPEEEIRQGKSGRVLHPLLFRTGITEVHLLHFAFENLGQENCRIIAFANVAQHLAKLDLEKPETFNPELLSTFCADNLFR
jgi:hypothetical protein